MEEKQIKCFHKKVKSLTLSPKTAGKPKPWHGGKPTSIYDGARDGGSEGAEGAPAPLLPA
jgi:hypothetical protein